MNKKSASIVLACLIAFGLNVATLSTVDAKRTSLTDKVAIKRENPSGMVLTMPEIAGLFTEKYPDAAIHSIELKPKKGLFVYEVEGYTIKNTYKVSIDAITGVVSKESKSGKTKNLVQKIFNPSQVIDPKVAQQLAVQAVGEGAVSKGWNLEADKGIVTYTIEVVVQDQKIDVTLNAKDGSIMAKSAPEKVVEEN